MMEDYYETQDEELIQDFKLELWSSKYTYKRYKKAYTYEVNEEKLHNRDDLISLFKKYEKTEVMYCKSFYTNVSDGIDQIRIRVNNMYGYISDKDVYLPKEYYRHLDVPKSEYFKAIKSLEDGLDVSYEDVKTRIDDALITSEEIRENRLKTKVDLTFNEYQDLLNTYIDRVFENYLPPYEYEVDHGWELRNGAVGWSEDNYVIKYFSKSLTGYLMNYLNRKEVAKIKECSSCQNEMEVENLNQKYCESCKGSAYKKRHIKYNRKRQ